MEVSCRIGDFSSFKVSEFKSAVLLPGDFLLLLQSMLDCKYLNFSFILFVVFSASASHLFLPVLSEGIDNGLFGQYLFLLLESELTFDVRSSSTFDVGKEEMSGTQPFLDSCAPSCPWTAGAARPSSTLLFRPLFPLPPLLR